MTSTIHPAAPHHLPLFITGPGETDTLLVVMGALLLVILLMTGILFLRLHTLPERLAHKSQKLQFEIVAVLGLLALFTHIHLFWVAGLLLAMIDLPDFGTPLRRIAGSVEKIAGLKPGEGLAEELPPDSASRSPGTEPTHGRSPEGEHRSAALAGHIPGVEQPGRARDKKEELLRA